MRTPSACVPKPFPQTPSAHTALTAYTPSLQGLYCLHSLLYIDSSYAPTALTAPTLHSPYTASTHCCRKNSYRPPMRAQTPSAAYKKVLTCLQCVPKPPPPTSPNPLRPLTRPLLPPLTTGLQCVPKPPPPPTRKFLHGAQTPSAHKPKPPPPPHSALTASTHYRPPMRAQTPSAPTALTAYTPAPHCCT